MNELQIFKSEEFGQVRTTIINNEPYFVGKDIAEVLGYSNTRDALATHVDEEDKNTVAISDGKRGNPNQVIINESGLYSLIFGSKLESAKQFKKWVTNDVLPTIRKTGGYVNNDDTFIRTYLPFADDTTKALFKTTLQTVRQQNELIIKQQAEITYKEDVIIGLVDKVDLAEKRQILNRVVRYKGANFQERWRELYKQFEMKYHIDLTRKYESYNLTHKPKMKSKVDYIDRVMNKISELYEIAAKLYESDVKELANQLYYLN
jgi:prophage antirepressor-like protein